MPSVLILGGYGNFGKRIAQLLVRQNVPVIIAGRNLAKASALAATLPASLVTVAVFDMTTGLAKALTELKPGVVINTCGPFQGSSYHTAQICIAHKTPYIDLADDREFVTGITVLDAEARQHGIAVISGASTVPGLSSAVLEHYRSLFKHIELMRYGIAPGQKAERGLATTQGILSYVGKRLKPCAGYPVRYGWQNLYRQTYPGIGKRWMANCEIPDLDLFPEAYKIDKIQFSAGMENGIAHLGIWLFSWLIRLGLPLNLARHSAFLLRVSNLFDAIGSADGGMHIILKGISQTGSPLTKTWFIVAKKGDGPYIPTVPAVILAKKILAGTFTATGAIPCIGLVSLEEYLQELEHLDIKTHQFDK